VSPPQTQDASAGWGGEGARYRYPSNARQQASVARLRLVRDGLFHERYCGSLAVRADAASHKMPPAFCAPKELKACRLRPCRPRSCRSSPAGSKNADQTTPELKLPTGPHFRFRQDQRPAKTTFPSSPAIRSYRKSAIRECLLNVQRKLVTKLNQFELKGIRMRYHGEGPNLSDQRVSDMWVSGQFERVNLDGLYRNQ
jgi:hypothetical protein